MSVRSFSISALVQFNNTVRINLVLSPIWGADVANEEIFVPYLFLLDKQCDNMAL